MLQEGPFHGKSIKDPQIEMLRYPHPEDVPPGEHDEFTIQGTVRSVLYRRREEIVQTQNGEFHRHVFYQHVAS